MNPDQPYVMRVLGALLFAAFTSFAAPAAAQDVMAATGAYRELQDICARDRGRLWGADLCGPLLVADPTSRAVWASESGPGLSDAGAGWTGVLPAGVPIANTSVNWAGQRWIMVLAPLPDDETERRVLVGHEAWHRIQGQIGLAALGADCVHLEQERARVLLRLEFRALATALRSRSRARANAAREALIFRAARLAAFPAAAAQEAALDRNEGLASYTGVRLGARDNADLYAARTLDDYDRRDSYARSYAYASGPAYGLLLDRLNEDWRSELGALTPADMLAGLLRPPFGDAATLAGANERYAASAIAAEEQTRAQAQSARLAQLRVRFASGPRLLIPVTAMQMEFDPNQVTPIEGLGSVYGVLTVRDRFGEVRATEGAMINSSFTQVIVPLPAADGLSGPGWSVQLAEGAQISAPDVTGARTLTAP